MSGISRRRWITAGIATTAGASGLAAAASLARRYGLLPPETGGIYAPGAALTYAAQRLITRHSLAREFPRIAISAKPFANGPPPNDRAFTDLQQSGFSSWRLTVDGMVAHPLSLSLAELHEYPNSSHITHLACEEGWSFIAEWTGVPLSYVLERAGIQPQAKYVVYRSIQEDWWDSLDMSDALHPQTLVTFGMNGDALPVAHGGPLRLRVPRQLGYKSVKYITQLTVTDSMSKFGGASAADGAGYSWYAGI